MKNTKRVVLLFGFVLALVALLVACGTSTEEMPEPEATEDLTPKHTVKISVDFISNLIFSKYDVEVDIDGTRVGVLDHGEDGEYNLTVKEGIHTLTFSNNVSSSVNGSVKLAVASDVVASYRISCYKDRVDVETLQVDYLNNSSSDKSKINGSNVDFHGKTKEEVIAILQGLGFSNIQEEPIADVEKWDKKEGTVEDVVIDGKKDYQFGDEYYRDVEISLSYHVAEENTVTPMPTQTPKPENTQTPEANPTPDEVLTIENNEDLRNLLDAQTVDPDNQAKFVEKYKGRTVEFDAIVFTVIPNEQYKTIFSYVIIPGVDSDNVGATLFYIEDISSPGFHWDRNTRPEYLTTGSLIRIQAEIASGNDDMFIYLRPTKTWGR